MQRVRIDPESTIPIVTQLSEQLTWLIASKALRQGEKLPTIRSLADELGVHMHTVRSAYQRLQAEGLVSVTRRRGTVVQSFSPEVIASSRPDHPTFIIGVLLPGLSSAFQPFIQAIHEAAEQHQWLPLITYTHDNPLVTERLLHQLITKQVDGFIVTSAGVSEEFVQMARSERFPPIVFVDTPHITNNCILPDSEGAAYLATQHLLDHGYESIGLITPPMDWENVVPCVRGYQQALSDHGLHAQDHWVVDVSDFSSESGFAGFLELIERPQTPRAVFTLADSLALGALQAARANGVRVPEEIAIASYNDIPAASLVMPALTTATFPAFQLGLEAVQLLALLIAGEGDHGQSLLPTELILRQSCGCS